MKISLYKYLISAIPGTVAEGPDHVVVRDRVGWRKWLCCRLPDRRDSLQSVWVLKLGFEGADCLFDPRTLTEKRI